MGYKVKRLDSHNQYERWIEEKGDSIILASVFPYASFILATYEDRPLQKIEKVTTLDGHPAIVEGLEKVEDAPPSISVILPEVTFNEVTEPSTPTRIPIKLIKKV